MGSAWVSALAALLALVNGARDENDSLPCAEVRASSSVVTLGSPVTATCVVRDSCPLTAGQVGHIEWHLGQRLLPGSGPAANDSGGKTSTVLVPSFNATREYLTCCVHLRDQASPCQEVGGVEIRAGYPPAVPQNLSCQTNLTNPNTMTCHWDPGQTETHLWTRYTLHTQIWDIDKNYTYELPTGVQRYTIRRSDFFFFSEMEIYVRAENALGEASSIPLVLEPLRSVKFDPPKILKVQAEPNRYGCLRFSWGLLEHQAWVPEASLNLEVRLKTAETSQWSEPTPIRVTRIRPVEVCRLSHGTEYNAQVRVRYQRSPWSDWSRSQSGVTLERAPVGRLDYWLKVSGEPQQRRLVQLFWKPSKQFRANGRNVSYVVLLPRLPGEKGQACSTSERHCTFQVPRGVKKVLLCARNAAGKSCVTDVPVFRHKDRTALSVVTVLPRDNDRSLFVQWARVTSSAGVTDYVVEWRPLLNTDPSLILFDLADRNQSSLIITDGIEPYKPYEISVYPRYGKDAMGHPWTVEAYSRQKAPSMVPTIKVKEAWQSNMELTWDEIPIGQRNGIIQRYRVYYWHEENVLNFVDADLEKRSVVLRNLNYLSLYKAFITVSTDGGSRNGSTVTLKTEPMDAVSVVIVVISCGVILALSIIIMVMTCEQRLKVCCWPPIPDPVNSSIKKWTSETIEDTSPAWDIQEPNPVYLSHLSFLDLSKKLDKTDEDWPHNGSETGDTTSDLGESICGSPLTPGYSVTTSESVPYATVIFAGPYATQPADRAHVYLRSESTQPLLEAEESFSPKSYQNMAADGEPNEQYFFGQCQDKGDVGIGWDDFPMLRALAMNDAHGKL